MVNKHNRRAVSHQHQDPTQIERVRLPEALAVQTAGAARAGPFEPGAKRGADRTLDLVSDDGWKAPRHPPAKKRAHLPTTAAAVGKDLYVMNSRLDSLLTPDAPKVSSFVLQKY